MIAQPERILVTTIALAVPAIALHVLVQHLIGVWVVRGTECERHFGSATLIADCGPTNGAAGAGLLLGLFALFVIGHLVVAGMYRCFLDVVDGRPARNPYGGYLLRVLPTALVLGAALTIGTLVMLVPGLVIGFFTRYALLFAVDRELGVLAAIGASFAFCGTRLLSEAGFVLRASGVLLLGLLCLGAGLFVAIPVVLIAQTLRYRDAG
ncbi:hypothetical protein EFK50_20720 [Nocardioides marmoriginsengisoli]|uniref:Uncharacterized protein n=1 Tax=Nocardioides marmoriginsengisoli TaxID=661483 RepID=A0A3N0CBU9_9ACTN|nr:hypothetical protein EFK50_20720 [Nocardioides marmoriginsengisoli]